MRLPSLEISLSHCLIVLYWRFAPKNGFASFAYP
jgi:hypothetical protein